jgi:hypothetical protein
MKEMEFNLMQELKRKSELFPYAVLKRLWL